MMKTRKTIAMLLCISLLLSMLALPASAADKAETLLASMTTEQKVSQMLMPAFRYFEDGNGDQQGVTEMFPEMEQMLKQYSFGGVILFAQNTAENQQTARLTDAIQKANASVPGRPQLLISTDQEGGNVTRLGEGTQMPGNMALGAASLTVLTEQAATVIGQELGALGINMDFAPVLDVNNNPGNPVIGIRSFSDDPWVAAAQGEHYMTALQETGTISTLKHFPGHGDTDTDSHTGLPSISKTYDQLKENELIPFQVAVEAGAEVVMTAHIQYPSIEKTTYQSIATGEDVYLPATLSKTILTDILRGDMGYEGVIITDAMDMDAIQKHFDPMDAAKLAIEAGVDIILMPVDISTKAGMKELEQYIAKLTALVEDGTISQSQVDAAVLRILRLKAAHGLLDAYDDSDLDGRLAQAETVGSKTHHEIEWEITKKAVTLLKNDHDMLPLIGEGEKTVALTAYDNEVLSMEYAVNRLRDEGKLAGDISVYSIQSKSLEEALPLMEDADHVVIISELYRAANLNPNEASGAYSVKVDGLIEAAHEKGIDVAIMSCYLPYDAARYPEADAMILAWGARGMSEDPRNADKSIKQYGPNIPAAFYMMLSPDEDPSGLLPVNIPALTEDYQYSDEILYPRGYGLGYSGQNAAAEFSDVSEDAWYHKAVQWATSQKPAITNGTGNNTFSPNAPVTRAQVVTMLWRWAGAVEDDYPDAGFTDVPADAYYATAVNWAALAGIVKGTARTAFSPDRPCTRAEAVTLLYRAWSLFADTTSVENPFSDVAEGAYYRDAVLWAVEEGITKGTSKTEFSPNLACDRAETVTFLYRLIGSFHYYYDPRKNPSAMADIVLDRDAVYGFRPSETGSLSQYADADWTDEASVAQWRQARIEYHESLEELYGMIEEMQDGGKSTEEIARAVSTRRNELRLEAYAEDPEGLERLKARNLEQYGHEEGPLPEELFEKYGSWTMVLAKALSTNSGMDACLGLYDTYYDLYVVIGQVEPWVEPAQAA